MDWVSKTSLYCFPEIEITALILLKQIIAFYLIHYLNGNVCFCRTTWLTVLLQKNITCFCIALTNIILELVENDVPCLRICIYHVAKILKGHDLHDSLNGILCIKLGLHEAISPPWWDYDYIIRKGQGHFILHALSIQNRICSFHATFPRCVIVKYSIAIGWHETTSAHRMWRYRFM